MEILSHRPMPRISRRALLALAAALLARGAAQEKAPAFSEYEVKAALIYKFMRFLEWPDGAMPEDGAPFLIGVLGDDPFGEVLDRTVAGKTVAEHAIAIRRAVSAAELRGCQAVFICSSEKERLRPVLRELDDLPALTLGDTDGFAEMGIMINLVVREKKVKFQINYSAARAGGIEIDAQLLKLAEIVEPPDDGDEAPRG